MCLHADVESWNGKQSVDVSLCVYVFVCVHMQLIYQMMLVHADIVDGPQLCV